MENPFNRRDCRSEWGTLRDSEDVAWKMILRRERKGRAGGSFAIYKHFRIQFQLNNVHTTYIQCRVNILEYFVRKSRADKYNQQIDVKEGKLYGKRP